MILFLILFLINDVEIKEIYNFGEVLTEKLVPHTFIFQNESSMKIKIANIYSTDHLEILSYPEEIPPRGISEINVILDTKDLRGNIKRAVNVDYAFEGEEEIRKARFIIEGIVHKPVEARLLKDESIFYSYYPSSVHHTFQVSFYSDKISEYKIERIEITGDKKIDFKKEIISSNEKNEFIIKVFPEKTPEIGNYGFYLGIKTNVPDTSEILLPFYFEIKDPFTISSSEIVFHSNKVFNKVRIIKNCYFYYDFEMKNIFNKFIDLKNIYLFEEKENKAHIGNENEKFWVMDECIENLKPTYFEKNRTIYLNQVNKKPFKLKSISLESDYLSYFYREDSPSLKAIVITLNKEVEKDEEFKLLIETDYLGKEKIEIPIFVYKE